MSEVTIDGISGTKLKQYVERVENIEQNKSELANQILAIFAEAKAEGFDVKILRQLIRMRKMKKEELAEQEELLELYRRVLGE